MYNAIVYLDDHKIDTVANDIPGFSYPVYEIESIHTYCDLIVFKLQNGNSVSFGNRFIKCIEFDVSNT